MRDANLSAFNTFLEQYLPRFSQNAYNSTDYTPPTKKDSFYLLNCRVSIFTIQYIRKNYSHLSPIDKFKRFLHLVQDNEIILDALICEIAKYSFSSTSDLSESHKKIVNNFMKGGKNMKEQSSNAAYDIMLIRIICMSYNRALPNFNRKIDS